MRDESVHLFKQCFQNEADEIKIVLLRRQWFTKVLREKELYCRIRNAKTQRNASVFMSKNYANMFYLYID